MRHLHMLMLENYLHITVVVWCANESEVDGRPAATNASAQPVTSMGWTGLWCTQRALSGGALGNTGQFSRAVRH